MGTLTYLILSILSAILQHEILASPSGLSRSMSTAWILKGAASPEYAQGIRDMFMNKPTKVDLVLPDKEGRYTRVTGHGLAVHPHFIAVRPHDIQRGCKIASYYLDNKIQYFDIESVSPSPKNNVFLLYTDGLILLDNGHRLPDGFTKYKYGQREYDWVKFKVNDWIVKHTLPIRHYRGDED